MPMATARDDSNPYGGLGAGGKFRKKPYRKPQSTPYDRPPTAIRNPTIVPGAGGNGWLRKLMDPAQKLLASTAQRFYASVFRKRLTQPSPPPPQPPGAEQEGGDKHVAAFPLDMSKEQGAASNGNQKPTPSFVPGERSSTELEEILKQKTFTRSEIDRLMGLLSARVVDNSVRVEEKTPDVPSRGLYRAHKEEVANVPLQDNGSGSRLISSKAANSSVLDEDIASPAELAKAYMGSRPSKMSPSMLGIRSQALGEDSSVLSGLVHSSKSPILSLVPSSSGHVGVRENGYATPRSRGRSAIYSMARTPYSRVHVTSTPKSSGLLTDGYDGPSSTERNSIFGSTKAPKRSSSIFENDIGSGGPMRRVRQKPNLSHRKNWIMSTSETGEPSSSAAKMQPVSERKLSFTEQSNAAPVSSQSAAMASKILQQLDKIVSPPLKDRSSELKLAVARENAPANLSASKLKGQALKSLEHIDSSKFLEFSKDKNKPDDAVARFSHDSGETSKQKQARIEQNGPSSIFAASDKVSPSVNGLENSLFAKKDVISIGSAGDTDLTNSLDPAPVQKKRAFKMSAHEDFLDLEDDVYSNGLSSSPVKVNEKQDTSTVEHKPTAVQATITSEKQQTVSSPISFSMKETTSQGANGKQTVPQTHVGFSFPSVPAASTTSQPDVLAVQSPSEPDRAALLKESNAALPMFSSGDKVGLKDQSVHNSVFGFPSNNESTTSSIDKSPQLKFGEAPSGGLFGQRTLGAQSSSSDASVAGGLFSSMAKVPESGKTEDKKPLKDGVFSGVPDSAAVPATSSATFTFGIKSANLSNGSTVSTAIPEDSNTSQKPFSISSPVISIGNTSSSDLSSTVAATTSSLPTFRFGASSSSSTSQASSTITAASGEAKTKPSVGSGNIISNPFVAANSSSGSSIFGFGFGATSATSNANNIKEGFAITGAANGPAVVPESPAAGAGLASFTQTVPVQFGSSSSSSGPSTNVAASSGSSLFGSSFAANPFPSFGSSAASSSETSSLIPISSSPFGQGTATSPPTGFPFGSSSSSSTFVFGSAPGSSSASSTSVFGLSGTSPVFGSSTSASSSNSVPAVFGSTGTSSASTAASVFGSVGTSSASTAAPAFGSNMGSSISNPVFGSMGASSGTTFSFTAASANSSSGPTFPFTATAAPAALSPSPAFGSSNSPFAFGSPAPASKINHDQMSMEDSMAEDTFQANHGSITPAPPVFGQQQQVSPPAAFMFGSSAAPGASPFQFGAPQNPSTPQNPSPFQASGSQNFNASGGSFSLGTGGGDKSARRIVKVNRKARRK